MKNDFKPVVGHRFNLRADWNAVDCQVLAIEPNKTLSYTWAAYGLESVVTWTLSPTALATWRQVAPPSAYVIASERGGRMRPLKALPQPTNEGSRGPPVGSVAGFSFVVNDAPLTNRAAFVLLILSDTMEARYGR
jgi:hypothetical protein